MSFREVTLLRKEGRLDDALDMARADYSFSIDNYSASALFWILRVFCERSLNDGDSTSANAYLKEMQEVFKHMSDGDGISGKFLTGLEAKVSPEFAQIAALMSEAKTGNTLNAYSFVSGLDFRNYPMAVKKNIAWVCFYHIKYSIERLSVEEFDSIIDVYAALDVAKPSLVHSRMLTQAVKFAGLNPEYDLVTYLRKWGVQNFSAEDCTSNPSIAGGLSLKDRAIRRCFINRSVKLTDVVKLFADDVTIDVGEISTLLSRSYYTILYQDSAELKDRRKFFADAGEYISRIGGVSVCNAYHSKILDSVLWEIDNPEKLWFKSFFEGWGFAEAFMEEDWKSVQKNGMSRSSLVERSLTKYADSLELSYEAYHPDYKALLATALSKLDDSENISRRLAKLCFAEGNGEEAVNLMKNLIKTQGAKYYFWSDLAEYVSDDQKLCAACYAKALLLNNDEKFVGKIHLALGELLHCMGKDNEALFEIERYRITNEQNGWPVRSGYNAVRSQLKQDAKAPATNGYLYKELEILADEFVFSDVPSYNMIMLESRFEENAAGKRRLMFYLYDSQNKRYRVNPNTFGLDRKSKVGSCFAVKLVNADQKCKIISVKPIQFTDVLSYEQAVVDNVNDTKKVIHILGKGFQMVVPMSNIRFKVKLCDTLDVAYTTRIKDGRTLFNCLDLRKSTSASSLLVKKSGTVKVRENANGPFGFLGDNFISGRLLDGIADGDQVNVEGVMENGKLKVLAVQKA